MKKVIMGIAVLALVLGSTPGHATTKMEADVHAPDHSGCRHATPSPRSGTRDTVLSEDFASGIPAGWSVIDNAGNGVVWTDLAGSGMGGNYTNGSGDVAAIDSDAAGAVDFDTELWMPALDLTNATATALMFTSNYQNYANYDFFDVDVSTDGGSTWTNEMRWNEDHGAFDSTPGEDVNIDLGAYDGMASVIVRYRYYDPGHNWDWYVQIDDVLVDATISQQPTPTPTPVEAIPTLNHNGLIAMAMLIGLVAVVVIRRRFI